MQKEISVLVRITVSTDEEGNPEIKPGENPLATAFPLAWTSNKLVASTVFRAYQEAARSGCEETLIRSVQTPRELAAMLDAQASQHADDILGMVETAPAATMPEPEPVKAKAKAKSKPAKSKPAEAPADALSILADADAG
jgi:hypothetical protein